MRNAYSISAFVRALNIVVALAALSTVAQLGCGGGGSSKDGGRDGKVDMAAHASDGGDAKTDAPVEATQSCADAGARTVIGQSCGCNSDCQSGFCVDGVCCDSACGDTCKRCDVQGSMGTCSFVPAGLAPRSASTCSQSDVKTCGNDGTCDGQGACRKYVMGTVCVAGKCDGAAVTNIQTCDGAGTCGGNDTKVCQPFACDATKQDCFGACTSNADCAVGVQCMNGTCGLKMKGSTCGGNGECASGFCTDGVCCAVACQGACVSCNQTGRLGTCWPIAQGVPDPRQVCKDSGAMKCGQTGTCDGFGSCAKYAPETVCIVPSCAGDRLNTPGTCDGLGTCKPPGLLDCTPFRCASGACKQVCATDADCTAGIACVNKTCGPKQPGGTCTKGTDCASGFCADGVCCNQACAGACQSCALTASRGTCTPVPANNVDNHAICKDQGATSCGTNGRCDGAGGCAKYAVNTVCGAEKCANNIYTGPPTCNTTGQCVAPATRVCTPFACNGTKCADSCTPATSTTACVAPNVCNNNSCGKKLPGAPCSAAAECASNFCAQGYCCITSCTASCKSCGLKGTEGTCTNVPTGTTDPKAMCLDQGAPSCGTNGKCVAGACQNYGAGTKCKDPACGSNGTTSTAQSNCDGAGHCATPTPTPCFPYTCGATSGLCNGSCNGTTPCGANATCTAGSCGLQPQSGPCTSTAQCMNGLVCVGPVGQMVCCNSACTGPCVSCTLPTTRGTCTPIASGQPDLTGLCGQTASTSCGNDGACDGKGACEKYPKTQVCVPQSCPTSGANANVFTPDLLCDGAGNCSVSRNPGAAGPCSPYAGATRLDEHVVTTSCGVPADCVGGNVCIAGPQKCGAGQHPGGACRTAADWRAARGVRRHRRSAPTASVATSRLARPRPPRARSPSAARPEPARRRTRTTARFARPRINAFRREAA